MITDIILLFLMIIITMVSSGRGYNIAKKDNRKSDGYLYLYIVLFMVFWTIYLSKPMRTELSSKKYEWKTEYRTRRTVQIVDMSDTLHLESRTDTVLVIRRK